MSALESLPTLGRTTRRKVESPQCSYSPPRHRGLRCTRTAPARSPPSHGRDSYFYPQFVSVRQVGGFELVCQFAPPVIRHRREAGNGQIFVNSTHKAIRPLTVKTTDQGNSLLAGDVAAS